MPKGVYPHIKKFSVSERFWKKVNKKTPDDCWNWIASCFHDGYPQFRVDGAMVRAHRFSYGLHFGEIPEGLFVMHTCDNPRCVNPNHLVAGTHEENIADMVRKGRSTIGSKNPASILKESDIPKIKHLCLSEGMQQKDVARLYGVCKATISSIMRGKRWKHIEDSA